MDLPTRIVQHDGYRQQGTEVADLTDDRRVFRGLDSVRRLKKLAGNPTFRFSDVDEELEFYNELE